jgi:hypothetical protein
VGSINYATEKSQKGQRWVVVQFDGRLKRSPAEAGQLLCQDSPNFDLTNSSPSSGERNIIPTQPCVSGDMGTATSIRAGTGHGGKKKHP